MRATIFVTFLELSDDNGLEVKTLPLRVTDFAPLARRREDMSEQLNNICAEIEHYSNGHVFQSIYDMNVDSKSMADFTIITPDTFEDDHTLELIRDDLWRNCS